MAMFSDTFGVVPTHSPLQFIPYNGPPKPKKPSQRNPSKIPFSKDEAGLNAEPEYEEDVVKLVDLTYLSDEDGNSKISGSKGGESGVVLSHDCFSPMTEQGGALPTSREDTKVETPYQLAPSKGSGRGNTVVIQDSQSNSEAADEGDPQEDDANLHISDQLELPTISTLEYLGGESPTSTNDASTPGTADGAKTETSELPHWKLPSTPPTRPSMDIEQATPESAQCIQKEATTPQLQRPIEEKTEREVGRPPVESMNSSSSSSISSSGNDADDDVHSSNHTASLTRRRKRKRSPPTPRHIQTPNMTSKQRPKHVTHSARQRKPSTIRNRRNRPSARGPVSAAQYSSYRADTRDSDSDDSSGDTTDNCSARQLASNLCKHKRKRKRGNADEDDEYEVENILDARVNRKRLQYRVKWLGYEDDPVWYDAANFKNSPYKLYDFHAANPLHPGPPKRLGTWLRCWEEDRDADDHLDDNRPERAYTRGGAQ